MGRMYLSSGMTPDSLDDVRRLAENVRGFIDHIYLHWTAGHYGQAYDDYHICIDEHGEIYLMCDSFTERKAHTLGRNTGAVGISLCCCSDASCRADATIFSGINLGSEPPTAEQIEVMAEVVAVLAGEFGLRLDNDEQVMTHYEAAKRDSYAPGQDSDCRWDLWYIPDYYGADGKLDDGGALIRGKAAWYQRKWHGEFQGD